MRVVIAGSRHLKYTLGEPETALKNDYLILRDAIWQWERKHGSITTIVSGTNGFVLRGTQRFSALPEVLLERDIIQGADLLGEYYGRVHGVPTERFVPNWDEGEQAGPERSQHMIDTAEGLVAVFLPDSRGTHITLRLAALKRIPIVDVCLPFRRKW